MGFHIYIVCSTYMYMYVQWNPSMRTLLGPSKTVLIIEVSTFQGFCRKCIFQTNIALCMITSSIMNVFHFLTRSQKQGRGGSHGTKVNRGTGHGLEVPCVYRLYRTLAYIERLKTAVEEIERRRNEKFHCSTYRCPHY